MNEIKITAEEPVKEIDISEIPSLDDFMKELSTAQFIEPAEDFSAVQPAEHENLIPEDEIVYAFEETSAPAEIVLPESSVVSAKLRSESEIRQLRADNQRLQSAHSELVTLHTRLNADFDGFKKRVERERGDHYQFAVIHLVNQILPILDNFERALENAQSTTTTAETLNFINGIELIYQQLIDVLKRLGVERIFCVGENFDPAFHEAVAAETTNGSAAPNTIIEEVRRGYKLGSRLIRAAMVKVSTS